MTTRLIDRAPMLDVKETATRLNVSTKTVRRWIDRGELPAHRLGRLRRITEADLLAFINRHRG